MRMISKLSEVVQGEKKPHVYQQLGILFARKYLSRNQSSAEFLIKNFFIEPSCPQKEISIALQQQKEQNL